ncbi:MAG: hypothetical protein ABFE08_17875 [Armatimonadia bacterium]
MTAIKITKFLGTAPRNSPELLSETSAQVARNAKLYSGDLIPYPQPVIIGNTKRTGTLQTLYGLRDHASAEIAWLSFNNYVNIVTPATDELEEQRFYYTGDGQPKVSTYDLAVGSSSGPYPVDYYELGLPLPKTVPTPTPVKFTAAVALTYSRDAANIVTLKTVERHNLKAGFVVSISGFAYRYGTYSRSGTTITVTINDHGITTGGTIFLEFSSGTATTNSYVVTATGTNTFVVTDTVSGATSGNVKWDIRDLNTIAEAAVIDDTTISYFSPGPQVAETTVTNTGTYTQTASATATITSTNHRLATGDQVYLRFTSGTAISGVYTVTVTGTNTFTVILTASATTSGSVEIFTAVGRVDLGDQLQARTYLYTWFTPWREESIGSEPTEPIYVREGQIVTLSNLPNIKPLGKNNIGGIRLYRTLATTSGSNFFLLKTLWFPAAVVQVSRTTGAVSVTMAQYHNLRVDDRIKLVCSSDPTFDAVDAVVTRVVNADTFEFAQPGDDVGPAPAIGSLYYDISEKKTLPARYWGDGGDFTFTDDFNFRSLRTTLSSTEYEMPPEKLRGLTVIQNNILAGFVGNDLYFSEPGQYHAWPSQYRRSLEYDIVALATYSGLLLVLTTGFPYLIEGSSPSTLIPQKLPVMYPCVNAKSVVQTSFGIVWSTHDGLAVFNGNSAQLLTKSVHHSDTWNSCTRPANLVGSVFKENYIASCGQASLTLESVESGSETGLSFVDLDFAFTAAWFDNIANALYVALGTNGDVYRIDDLAQPSMTIRWRSKVFIAPMPVNLGAARIVADYDGESESPLWEDISETWENADYLWNGGSAITFNLYVDKKLIFTTERTDSGIFRLPAGYKSDTFEVEVLSALRVRAIHIGDTPTSLVTV